MSDPAVTRPLTLPSAALADYQDWLKTIKQRIHATRMKVALAANGELISLYYEIGGKLLIGNPTPNGEARSSTHSVTT